MYTILQAFGDFSRSLPKELVEFLQAPLVDLGLADGLAKRHVGELRLAFLDFEETRFN